MKNMAFRFIQNDNFDKSLLVFWKYREFLGNLEL